MKTSNSIWRPFPAFSKDVLEEELNALIQKAIPENTKIAKKYGLINLKGKKKNNLKYQFYSFTRRIVCISGISIGCLINSRIVYQKK